MAESAFSAQHQRLAVSGMLGRPGSWSGMLKRQWITHRLRWRGVPGRGPAWPSGSRAHAQLLAKSLGSGGQVLT